MPGYKKVCEVINTKLAKPIKPGLQPSLPAPPVGLPLSSPVALGTHVDADIELVGGGGASTETLTLGLSALVQPSSQTGPDPSSSMVKVVLFEAPSLSVSILHQSKSARARGKLEAINVENAEFKLTFRTVLQSRR